MMRWSELFFPKGIPEPQQESLVAVRQAFASCADVLEDKLPNGRYKSIVKTELEKVAAIATKSFSHEESPQAR